MNLHNIFHKKRYKSLFKASLICLLFLFLSSFKDPFQIKRISDENYRYEFYVTEKIIKPKTNKPYYWFKGGAVHYAESGIGGMLLDGNFTKAYHSNNLAEQGLFKVGLKTGLWKTWHPNGKIATLQFWKKGEKQGKYSQFTVDGNLIEKGKFNNDKKQGIWINYASQDTITYKKGLEIVKKVKLSKEDKILLKETAREKKKTDKSRKKLEKQHKKESIKSSETGHKPESSVEKPKSVKENIFKKLFSKRKKKNAQSP